LPTKVSALKRQAIADVGARIVIAGQNWNESLTMARAMAAESGAVYVEDGNDPALMAGAATVALEMLEEQPEIEIIVVPVGSGNLLAGCVLATSYPFVRGLQAAQALQREVEIIGVQSEAAPGSWLSWQRGEIVTAECKTFADGIATTRPLDLAFQVFHDRVAGMYLVSESELLHALALMVKHQTLIVEGAAAAPLAAVLRYPEYFARRRVALVVTGRNIDADTLARALESSDASHLPETLPVALTPA
jgi:threonine dehydratase